MNSYYYNNNNNYNNNRKSQNGGKVFIIVLLVVGLIALTALSSVGIYEYIKSRNPGNDTVPSSSIDNEDNTETDTESVMSPAEVAEKTIPSVVCIQNFKLSQGYGYGAPQPILAGEGSGVIYSSDGYIITNAHVVNGASLVKVMLTDDDIYEAQIIGIDKETDLAVIKIDADNLKPIEIGDYSALRVGDYVMAVGNPGGHEFSSSVTLGIVSAKDRPLDVEGGYTMKTIQTDAPINPGNSGGALVNMQGQLVGINSAKYVASGFEGLGFAITTEEAMPIIEDLIKFGAVKGRSLVGITGFVIDQLLAKKYNIPEGYYVDKLYNENAGTLKEGDIIISIDGIKITTASSIKNALNKKEPGDKITVEYYRSGNTYKTEITLIGQD